MSLLDSEVDALVRDFRRKHRREARQQWWYRNKEAVVTGGVGIAVLLAALFAELRWIR